MPVTALQHFLRMRGGAQAQLLLGDDGHFYVVKFQNNPQHRRVLANEMLVHTLLLHLQLPTPHSEVVDVSSELVAQSQGLYMEIGGRREPCVAGLQFGSRYPGNPVTLAVYDYIPDALMRKVANVDCFLGMAAFDKWVSNADGRQAVFFRDRVARWRPAMQGTDPHQRAMVVVMIDHGFAFTAQQWIFRDHPLVGIYTRSWVYEHVTGYEFFEPWLGWIRNCSPHVLDDAAKRVPPEWYDHDFAAMDALLEKLYSRRSKVPELLREAKDCPRDPFPNWR